MSLHSVAAYMAFLNTGLKRSSGVHACAVVCSGVKPQPGFPLRVAGWWTPACEER